MENFSGLFFWNVGNEAKLLLKRYDVTDVSSLPSTSIYGKYLFNYCLSNFWALEFKSLEPMPMCVSLTCSPFGKISAADVTIKYILTACDDSPKNFLEMKMSVEHMRVSDLRIALPITRTNLNYAQFSICGYLSISVKCEEDTKAMSIDNTFTSTSLQQLSTDFGDLLKDASSCFSDVTLKCGSDEIQAHKNILIARSPVFASMFSNNWKENHSGTVDIEDVEPSTLQCMLEYIYTGGIHDLTDASAEELLFVADKYELQGLKKACIEYLKRQLSSHNVVEYLVLGDLHDSGLKSYAIDFACKSGTFTTMENGTEWKTLEKEKPKLAMELVVAMLKYKELS